jgi:hypothetical protein
MKFVSSLLFLFASILPALAAPLEDNIASEALLVTKAELRRHLAADAGDAFRPATYAELEASRGEAQPDYLVLRFKLKKPGHYYGQVEARIDGRKQGTRQEVVLHFNRGWVEYFIPLDGGVYAMPGAPGGPTVAVAWNELQAK